MGTMFQGLNDFERPHIIRFTMFSPLGGNVAIYAQKCSSTAQNRGRGVFSQFGQCPYLDCFSYEMASLTVTL